MANRYIYTSVTVLVASLLVSACGMLPPIIGGSGGYEAPATPSSTKQVLLVGTYTDSSSEGVYSYTMDKEVQQFRHSGTFVTPNPSYLAYDQAKKLVFIANEDGEKSMASSAQLDLRSGSLVAINSSFTLGADPVCISTNGKGKVVTANRGGGSITLFNVERGGKLESADWHILLGDKKSSRPHSACFSPSGKDLYVSDLAQDKVFHFNVSKTNPPLTIDQRYIELPKGSAPRHIVMDKTGKYAYVITEKRPQIFVFQDMDGKLEMTQEVSLRLRQGSHGQHIVLSADGKFLYTSHCDGENIISIFKIDRANGELTLVGKQVVGKKPRHFAISPDGTMLAVACVMGNKIEFYNRNTTTGLLTPIKDTSLSVSHPAFVLWVE